MYILNKYEYGYRAYKKGYKDSHNPQSKSLSNELKCITYYMKKEGKSLDEILLYMNKQLEKIYTYARDREPRIRHRIEMIKREYALDERVILFCKNEVDFLKKQKKNDGRLLFYMMCIYKMYGNKNINIVNEEIRIKYCKAFNRDVVDKIIHTFNQNKIISSKMIHFKNGNVDFVTTLSDKIINLYDNNPIYTFTNAGNIKLLFDYVTDRNKNVIFCEKCGVIVERNSPNSRAKYCAACANEVKQKMTKTSVYKSRNITC